MDHLVNNVSCKNPRINGRLAPVIQNMFVVYQREIIELLIDDLLAEEVRLFFSSFICGNEVSQGLDYASFFFFLVLRVFR